MPKSVCVIAIDGPSGSGKGTLAQRLANHLGFAYLDTGLLYRAVGMAMLDRGHATDDAVAATQAARVLSTSDLARDDLRGDAVAMAASKVAAIAQVRAALLDFQRRFAADPPDGAAGAVLDGRDIGTVVCPSAAVKLFVTASLAVRADRRVKELRDRGLAAIHEVVLRDMQERDARDSQRAIAPLEPATDAFVIDTSDLDRDSAFAVALAHVEAVASQRRGAGFGGSGPGKGG